MQDRNLDALLTIHDVASTLKISFCQALALAVYGAIKAVKVADELRVRHSDLVRFIQDLPTIDVA
jgi:hypothetical protein